MRCEPELKTITKFKGSWFRANMTASQMHMHLAYYPPQSPEILINLPNNKFVRVTSWLHSFPPQAGKIEIVRNYSGEKYAIAEQLAIDPYLSGNDN